MIGKRSKFGAGLCLVSSFALAGCAGTTAGTENNAVYSKYVSVEPPTFPASLTSDLRAQAISASGNKDAVLVQSSTVNGIYRITIDGKVHVFSGTGSVSTDGMAERIASTTRTVNGIPISSALAGQYSYIGAYFLGTGLSGANRSVQDVVVVANGSRTPVASLPVGRAQYTGGYVVGGVAGTSSSGSFSATADFVQNTLTGVLTGGLSGTANGVIKGATFGGEMIISGSTISTVAGPLLTGKANLLMAGGFFGPSADEIAGVARGKVQGAGLAVGFRGNKQ